MFYYRFAKRPNGEASTCAAMHGKYSSLDSFAVMNTNLSVGTTSASLEANCKRWARPLSGEDAGLRNNGSVTTAEAALL